MPRLRFFDYNILVASYWSLEVHQVLGTYFL